MRPRKDIVMAGWFLLVSLTLTGAIFWAWRQYIDTPPYVDPDLFPVRGIDMSRHNGYANFRAVQNAGYSFVFLKASEGGDLKDENFAINHSQAREAGLKTGAYHFFRFDRDGVEQALNLLGAVKDHPLELGLVIDVEEHGNAKGVPEDSVKFRLSQMTEYLNLRGYRVAFYTNREGLEKYLGDDFRGFPLWICSFSADNAAADDWTFWQFDHHGKVPGVHGEVDINTFRGNYEDFEREYPAIHKASSFS